MIDLESELLADGVLRPCQRHPETVLDTLQGVGETHERLPDGLTPEESEKLRAERLWDRLRPLRERATPMAARLGHHRQVVNARPQHEQHAVAAGRRRGVVALHDALASFAVRTGATAVAADRMEHAVD